MSAIVAFIGKLFSDIFIGVANEQLSTLGETHEIIEEVGTIELDSNIDDMLNEFRGL